MMKTEEFPRERWNHYFEDLTSEAKDCTVRVRVESQTLGDQVLAEGLQLVGISLEDKGTAEGAIAVVAERPDGTHLTHMIPDPTRFYLARDESKEALYLDIEDKAGTKTLVYLFRGRN